jgi:20S proteasome alpha/beta subunit
MTLCIAAQCRVEGADGFIIAADERIEVAFTGADIGMKISVLHEKWLALLAGNVAKATELMECIRSVTAQTPVTSANYLDVFATAIHRQKRRLIENYVRNLYGIGYDDFLKDGKRQFPVDVLRSVFAAISGIQLECELILVGYAQWAGADRQGHDPMILTISSDGTVANTDLFSVIGSGSDLAAAMLFHRQQTPRTPFIRSVYHVFEAMEFGKSAPGVGRRVRLMIITPDGIRSLTQEGVDFLVARHKELSLKATDSLDSVEVKAEYLKELKPEPSGDPKEK